MTLPSFDELWATVEAHEGETFRQVRGGEFTYGVNGNQLVLDRTNWNLPRSVLAAGYERWPVAGPGEFQDLHAPSYVFAILNDPRIVPRTEPRLS